MKLYSCIQGSPEWHAVRSLKLTASNAQAIASNGKGLQSLVLSLLTEHYSQNPEKYTNSDMERGIAYEDTARKLYELETGKKVLQVGFVEIDQYTGYSPDGHIGKDGGIEIKCLNDTNHMKAIIYGDFDKKYWWQVQMSLLLSGRKWWDVVLYNPNFDKNLLIFRQTPDKKMQEKLEQGIEEGKKLLITLIQKYER